jgi:hypothetical protein
MAGAGMPDTHQTAPMREIRRALSQDLDIADFGSPKLPF